MQLNIGLLTYQLQNCQFTIAYPLEKLHLLQLLTADTASCGQKKQTVCANVNVMVHILCADSISHAVCNADWALVGGESVAIYSKYLEGKNMYIKISSGLLYESMRQKDTV